MTQSPRPLSLGFAFAKHPREAGCFAKTQTWLKFALNCNYLPSETVGELHQTYDRIIGKLVRMITNPTPWILRS